MMPPTSIDGTDITGATIDGQDVQEITVDGQTVFTSAPQNLPVAYSDLVAWYPFDSATYGGSNADDVTAIIGGSGDDTAYNGSVNSATHQPSGGITDINAGGNSGAFDFDGSDDVIETANFGLSDTTLSVWFNSDISSYATGADCAKIWGKFQSQDAKYLVITLQAGDLDIRVDDGVDSFTQVATANFSANDWHHAAVTYDSNTGDTTGYFDGDFIGDINYTQNITFDNQVYQIGGILRGTPFDGTIDDARIYNRVLSSSEIQQIVQNTQDPNNPVYP